MKSARFVSYHYSDYEADHVRMENVVGPAVRHVQGCGHDHADHQIDTHALSLMVGGGRDYARTEVSR